MHQNVLFAAFAGEEQGLFGSRACAEIAAAEGWDLKLVINLDMVGHNSSAKPQTTIVEYDQGNRVPDNDAKSREFAAIMAQAAVDYTNLSVEHDNISNSDYMPFEARGYVCVGVYDGAAAFDFYHTENDTIDKVDLGYLSEVTKLVVGAVATISEPS